MAPFWEPFLRDTLSLLATFSQPFFRVSILYAPRMPADPFARSEFTRSFVFSLRACKRHANAHTLGPRAWDPGPQKRAQVPGPRGARGPFGPPGQGRLRRPWGPWGPLGLFRGDSERGLFCGKREPNECEKLYEFLGLRFLKFTPWEAVSAE